MRFKPYPKYKPSGVEWLGDVPDEWEVKPIKTLASCNDDTLEENTDPELEIQYVDISSVDASVGIKSREQMLFGNAPSRARRKVQDGDVIVSTVRTYLRAIARVQNPEDNLIVSTGFAVIRPRRGLAPSFAGYLLTASYFIEDVIARSTGVSYPAINASELIRIKVAIPTPSEQSAIATFLERETAKIDTLIAKQEKLIELLKEKRQAIISHAVTKGLNPNVKMKDSGIEWLGEVPEHWEVKPFRYCIEYQEGPGILASDFEESGVPLIRVSGVQSHWATLEGCNFLNPQKVAIKWKHFQLAEGDLLISASASMGTVCEVGSEAVGAIPYTGLIRLRGLEGIMLKSFVRHLVVSSLFMTQIDLLKAGATIQHFGPTHLSQMTIAKPPLAEQESIAAFIDLRISKIDMLIAKAELAITLQQEHRIALISAAVTGKIDVRESA